MNNVRAEFPLLARKNLVYLDTAASAQKPRKVIEGVKSFLETSYSNVHRGAHFLGDEATEALEKARKKVSEFIGASSAREIIFTKNATEAINLVARTLDLKKGDIVLLTTMEHHANHVPWIQLLKEKGIELDFLGFDAEKNLILDEEKIKRAKVLSFVHVSNVLGTRNDAKKLCTLAKKHGALTLIDACQSLSHIPIDVQDLNCDFLVGSAHKIYGPSGVGFLYGKLDLLKALPPFLGGGEMIREVSLRDFVPNEVPYIFEAGTPPIEAIVGFGLAIDFLQEVGMQKISEHDAEISHYAFEQLSHISEVKILSHKNANGLLTFTVQGHQNYDISDALSDQGICIRVGHHCAHPLHEILEEKTTLRASFGMYTNKENIDVFVQALKESI